MVRVMIRHSTMPTGMGYVKYGATKMKKKLDDRGIPMLYLGRGIDHSVDTARMLNVATTKVVNTRDVVWMNKVYGEWAGIAKARTPDTVAIVPVKRSLATGIEGAETSRKTYVMDMETRPVVKQSVVMDVEEAPVVTSTPVKET